MISINATKKAEIDAKRDSGTTPEEHRKKTAKEEAAALWKDGKVEAAFNKLLDII